MEMGGGEGLSSLHSPFNKERRTSHILCECYGVGTLVSMHIEHEIAHYTDDEVGYLTAI